MRLEEEDYGLKVRCSCVKLTGRRSVMVSRIENPETEWKMGFWQARRLTLIVLTEMGRYTTALLWAEPFPRWDPGLYYCKTRLEQQVCISICFLPLCCRCNMTWSSCSLGFPAVTEHCGPEQALPPVSYLRYLVNHISSAWGCSEPATINCIIFFPFVSSYLVILGHGFIISVES